MSDTQTLSHLNDVILNIEAAPEPERIEAFINTLAKQMQQSGSQAVNQWGAELQQAKPRLVKLCLQQGD